MESKDKRKYPRVSLTSPISYLCIDSSGEQFAHNMGIARDISRQGIKIETTTAVDTDYLMLSFADRNRNIIEIKGKVVYSKANESGLFSTGVLFSGKQEENISFVKELVMSYHASGPAKPSNIVKTQNTE